MLTRLLQRILVYYFNDSRLIRDGRDELVVHDNDAVVCSIALHNQVGNACSVSEGGDVTTNLVEGHGQVIGKNTGQLGFGLVTYDHDWRVGIDGLLGVSDGTTGGLGHGGMNTTTETLVGGDDNEKLALCGRF